MKKGSPYRDIAVAQGMIAILFFLLIPLANAFSPGSQRLSGVLHGLGASLTLIVATYTWHAYYTYAKGNKTAKAKLEWRLLMTNLLTIATIVAGNWLYIGYQAPEGASEWFKLHAPFGHWVIMEYKEFVSLMTFPLGVAASVLIRRFSGGKGLDQIRWVVGILLTFMWFCLFIGFTFGLVLAKWKLA
ncbi:hypothetical protein GC093_28420 [Paenibacillus sp. LMG 31456]|uniref:Uncharacterized protein n=1 Tax=Paenibacillus foliorum TaxID=2654974 RepID=A0A972K3M5_9BACL|nr:hypothetical protein [Paenibacillus foliorum]NOU97120.1 hypothetical protein [Paenibacillus foliorum]